MITEKELLAAIDECIAEPLTEKKVERLATYYIIYDHLFGRSTDDGYSNANAPESRSEKVETEHDNLIRTDGTTEFLRAVNGKDAKGVWNVLNELMTDTIKIINPRLYDGVINKISQL